MFMGLGTAVGRWRQQHKTELNGAYQLLETTMHKSSKSYIREGNKDIKHNSCAKHTCSCTSR